MNEREETDLASKILAYISDSSTADFYNIAETGLRNLAMMAATVAVNHYASQLASVAQGVGHCGELAKALTRARVAIASLDKMALGAASVEHTDGSGWAYDYPLRDELLAEIDAALASPAQSSWQPIETAPEDGTPVDLYSVSKRRWCGYRWDKEIRSGMWSEASAANRRWDDRPSLPPEVMTHWMPCPTPPLSSTGGGTAA